VAKMSFYAIRSWYNGRSPGAFHINEAFNWLLHVLSFSFNGKGSSHIWRGSWCAASLSAFLSAHTHTILPCYAEAGSLLEGSAEELAELSEFLDSDELPTMMAGVEEEMASLEAAEVAAVAEVETVAAAEAVSSWNWVSTWHGLETQFIDPKLIFRLLWLLVLSF
jgi:hypothetical protein